jgi:hypothetical protein
MLLLHARFHIPYYYRLLYTQAIPSLALISVGQPRLASCCSLTAYTARVAWATVCLAVIAASIPSINQLGRASGTPVSEQPTAAVSHDQGQQPAPNHWLALTLLCGGRGAKDCLGGRLTFTYLSLAGYATLPSCKLPSASTRSLECCAASQASPCRPRRRRPCAPVLAALHTPERPSRQFCL